MATKKTSDSPSNSRKTDPADSEKPATGKRKSTAKKLAAAVSDTVKEITEKVTGKPSRRKASATSTAAKKPATARSKNAPSRTRVGALTPEISSSHVREGLQTDTTSGSMPDESAIQDEAATDVKQHFFHEQHVHEGPPPAQAARELPDEYGDTKLVLMIRDPEWVYAYWELNDSTRQQFDIPRNGNRKRHILRLYKITGVQWPDEPAHYYFDVELAPDSRSWYVHLPEPDEMWCAELGIIDGSDQYTAICRSNPISTPRNSISEHIDSEWMIVQESFEKITRLSGANLEERLRGDADTGSESILRHIHRQLTGMLPTERSGLSSGIFSSESAIAVKDKAFWLDVHTEVILYGATEADAHVTVQGQDVKLNADGTFSIRYALPEGQQVLQVHARNADGDLEETITPVVERTTRS